MKLEIPSYYIVVREKIIFANDKLVAELFIMLDLIIIILSKKNAQLR